MDVNDHDLCSMCTNHKKVHKTEVDSHPCIIGIFVRWPGWATMALSPVARTQPNIGIFTQFSKKVLNFLVAKSVY